MCLPLTGAYREIVRNVLIFIWENLAKIMIFPMKTTGWFAEILFILMEMNDPICPSVGWSVGALVNHNL